LDLIEAAGGIIERSTPEGPLIAVIYRQRYGGEWALPKGKRQRTESLRETAAREVKEEVGFAPVIGSIVGATTYSADGTPKIVIYWGMQAVEPIPPFAPNDEVKKLEWLPPADAIMRLIHKEDRNLIRRKYALNTRIKPNTLVDRLEGYCA
jgi:8-oxo-(d)GTP phosphatase